MYTYSHPHPAVTADVVVFSKRGSALHVLLIQRRNPPFAGAWALPGGFLEIDESLEDCARRELLEETGVEPKRLEQLHCFGTPGRDPRERVVTVAFTTMVDDEDLTARSGSDAAAVAWFDCAKLPDLAFDHREIIAMARDRLT